MKMKKFSSNAKYFSKKQTLDLCLKIKKKSGFDIQNKNNVLQALPYIFECFVQYIDSIIKKNPNDNLG